MCKARFHWSCLAALACLVAGCGSSDGEGTGSGGVASQGGSGGQGAQAGAGGTAGSGGQAGTSTGGLAGATSENSFSVVNGTKVNAAVLWRGAGTEPIANNMASLIEKATGQSIGVHPHTHSTSLIKLRLEVAPDLAPDLQNINAVKQPGNEALLIEAKTAASLRVAVNRFMMREWKVYKVFPDTGKPDMRPTYIKPTKDLRIRAQSFSAKPYYTRKSHMPAAGFEDTKQLVREYFAHDGTEGWAQHHATTGWWNSYQTTHPAWFAHDPSGKPGYKGKPAFAKLRYVPECVKQHVDVLWQGKGKPLIFSVSPNDGVGFDTSAFSMALDAPNSYTKTDVWNGTNVDLSARMLRQMSLIVDEVKKRPGGANVMVQSIAYSRYRMENYPYTGVDLSNAKHFVFSFVHGVAKKDIDTFNYWKDKVGGVYLRNNLGFSLPGDGPYMPLQAWDDYFTAVYKSGKCRGFFQSKYWGYGLQSPLWFYVMVKHAWPDYSVEQIRQMWTSQFGAASEKMRKYLDYFEALSHKIKAPFPKGGTVPWKNSDGTDGLYEKERNAYNAKSSVKIPGNINGAGMAGGAVVYTDARLDPGIAHLSEALTLVPKNSDEAKRIQMLLDLHDLHKLRRALYLEFLKQGYNKAALSHAAVVAKRKEWDALRDLLMSRYGGAVIGYPWNDDPWTYVKTTLMKTGLSEAEAKKPQAYWLSDVDGAVSF